MNKRGLLWLFVGLGLLLCVAVAFLFLNPGENAPPETSASTVCTTTVQTTTAQETLAEPEFAYQGDYLTCINRTSILGIDVSSFQKNVDWEKVKSAGVEFVMIRIGFRGYGVKGVVCEDSYAQSNYQKAKAAGLQIGGYFFSQATSREAAIEEANYVLRLTNDWEMDMPIAYDWECHTEEYRTYGVTPQVLTDCTKAFCDTILSAGKDCMIYYNLSQNPKEMLMEELTDYAFWIGQYADRLSYARPVSMWQYSCTGTVPGISGSVDMNLFFPEPISDS